MKQGWHWKRLCLLSALVVVAGTSLSGAIYIKFEGVEGESSDTGHEKEIDVLAWSWGMSNSGTTHLGGGAGAGKVNVQDLSFTKRVDKSTPLLMQACANGTHIPKAILVCRKSGDAGLAYYVIELENLLVSSVSTGGSADEERLTENVSINFSKVRVVYTLPDADGNAGETVEMNLDLLADPTGGA